MKMFYRVALTVACFALSLAGVDAQAQAGRVTGRVLDAIQASPLPGVTVEVVGTGQVAHTDMDGRYTLALPAGTHQIKIALSGFAERVITVTLTANAVRDLDVTLPLAGFSEQVSVVGQMTEAATSSAATQLLKRRRATTINDNMGSQEMKANSDGDAAAALQRVTGLSVVDGQYIFVRGLGERYSNTTLGGAVLPSTQPERKVVALDMFPASLLDSVQVVKSFTPDRSAEFAGGLVELNMAKLPSRPTFDVTLTGGGNSLVWGQTVLDHTSGDRDYLGLKNSNRGLPSIFPNTRLVRGGIYTPELGELPADLERYAEALPNVWTPTARDGRANGGVSLAFGHRFGNLGVAASLNQSSKSTYVEEAQTYYSSDGDVLTPFSTYDYRAGSTTGSLSGLVNLAYQFSPSHRVSVQGFSTNRGTRETRTFEGYNDDAARNLRNARLLWLEEELRSGQVTGEHFFPSLSNSRIDWRATVSRSLRNEPDIRETLYQQIGTKWVLADESQSGLRMFNGLQEDAVEFAANWSVAFAGPQGLPALLKFGPSYSTRERGFDSRRFRFIPLNTVRFDLTQTPEQIFTAANIGSRYELREETRSTDSYDAEQDVLAGYAMLDISVNPKLRFIAGARVERYTQKVNTFDLFGSDVFGSQDVITGQIDSTDFFPAFNVVYATRPNQNLRVSFSQTVNRPEFRELAPFEFTDIVGGRAVIGNPDLERALIQNYDVRYEWFGEAEEVLSAGVFFKRFDQPIERFVEPTAQLRTSFTNAKAARNFGVELEARKKLSDRLLIGANYTFVDSSITLNAFQTNVLTSLQRPLAGTSKHIVNGLVEARLPMFTARLLLNSFSRRIAEVGSLGLPDIFEEGRNTIDAAVSRRIGRFNLRLSGENLTDVAVKYLQGPQTHRAFKLGRTFAFQIGFSAF
jgi:outer membrane receptor protein involved in Fe transport